jgi:HK97 family phage portal protein
VTIRSWFTRVRQGLQQRSAGWDWWVGWMPSWGWATPSLAGPPVTAQRAAGHSAVYACLRLISNAVGTPEWRAVLRQGAGFTIDQGSPAARALDTLDSSERVGTVFDYLSFGNAYIRVWRDAFGQILELERLSAASMTVKADAEGRLSYAYYNPYSGRTEELGSADILHLRNLCVGYWPNVGVSGLATCAETVGLALSLDIYRSSALANGSNIGGYLHTDAKLMPDKAKYLAQQWRENFSGGFASAKTPVLESGLSYTQLRGSSFADMLLPDAARLSIGEVARLFNLSPSLIGETLQVNRSTAQTEFEEAHRLCFKPIASDIGEQLARQLFTANQRHRGHWIDISLENWLRGSGAPLGDLISKLATAGVISIDDGRAWMQMSPLPDGLGALPRVPVNQRPVDAPEPAAAPPAPPQSAPPAAQAAPVAVPGSTVVVFPERPKERAPAPVLAGGERGMQMRPWLVEPEGARASLVDEEPDLPALEPPTLSWMERMGAALDAGDGELVGELLEGPATAPVELPEPPVPIRVQPLSTSAQPSAQPAPLEREALMARISAEIYSHLAHGLLPMCAEATASIRLEAIEQRREFLAELERLKELERAGRVLAAREERQAEADEDEELVTFRAELAGRRIAE